MCLRLNLKKLIRVCMCLFLFPLQFFQLEVYNSDGSRMTESQIHAQLLRIRSQSWKTDKEPMGILTSEHRHTWGQAYNRLLRGRGQLCTHCIYYTLLYIYMHHFYIYYTYYIYIIGSFNPLITSDQLTTLTITCSVGFSFISVHCNNQHVERCSWKTANVKIQKIESQLFLCVFFL